MKRVAVVLALMGSVPALANETSLLPEAEARSRATVAQASCGARLSGLEGLVSVNLAGSGSDYRLILVVRDQRTRLAARELLGGDVYGGHPLIWSVSDPSAARPLPPTPRPAPVATRYPAPQARPTPVLRVPAETRRTFWAGPVTLTPTRAYAYGRYSNCSPSRHGFLASGARTAPYCASRGASFAESVR